MATNTLVPKSSAASKSLLDRNAEKDSWVKGTSARSVLVCVVSVCTSAAGFQQAVLTTQSLSPMALLQPLRRLPRDGVRVTCYCRTGTQERPSTPGRGRDGAAWLHPTDVWPRHLLSTTHCGVSKPSVKPVLAAPVGALCDREGGTVGPTPSCCAQMTAQDSSCGHRNGRHSVGTNAWPRSRRMMLEAEASR